MVIFLHCNLGWAGYKNGYYYKGIFDVSNGAPIEDNDVVRSAKDGSDYQYDREIITNIH